MNLTIGANPPNAALTATVKKEAQQLKDDTQFVAENKGDPSALAGRIASIKEHWQTFQKDSSALQNTGNAQDIGEAANAEKMAFDSFEQIHGDLKEAVEHAEAGNAPEAAALRSNFASITDQGNANALHLQDINNHIVQLNREGAGIDGQYSAANPVTREQASPEAFENIAKGLTQYGENSGTGIASGGTVSPEEIAKQAQAIANFAITTPIDLDRA